MGRQLRRQVVTYGNKVSKTFLLSHGLSTYSSTSAPIETRKADRPTDGHGGSYGRYTSNNLGQLQGIPSEKSGDHYIITI